MSTNNKTVLVDGVYKSEMRLAVLDSSNSLHNLEYITSNKKQIKGNVYIGVIVRVEPALQAAFVCYGDNQNGFLPFDEISPEYYRQNKSIKLQKFAEKPIQQLSFPEFNIQNEDFVYEDANSTIDIEKLKKDVLSKEENLKVEEPQQGVVEESTAIMQKKSIHIQDVIERGQRVLVQVTKEERGHKGASLSTYISLIGRYCIFFPNKTRNNGVSKKITNIERRAYIKKIVEQFSEKCSGTSTIIRTAANKRSATDIKEDYLYLLKKWNFICETVNNFPKTGLVHIEEDFVSKIFRDIVDDEVKKVIVQGEEVYKQIVSAAKDILPSYVDRVLLFSDKAPIFSRFNVEDKIIELYQPTVHLKSGGSLVINPAEGMTLIDVNSGKSNAHDNIEQTAVQTNVEAALEIAKQLKLREISGLIIIDFIDMYDNKENIVVETILSRELNKDSAKIQIGSISQFGLLEMSRQRTNASFLETHTKICDCCLGKGVVRNMGTNDILILRAIASEISMHTYGRVSAINVYAHIDVILSVLNNKKIELCDLQSRYNVKIEFFYEENAQLDQFSIEKVSNKDKQYNRSISMR